MKFMKRDKTILLWINGFGFASADQIMRFMGVQKSACYARLKKLVDGGYLVHDYVLHGMSGIYRPTPAGALISGDDLRPLNSIRLSTFKHDMALVDLALDLSEDHKSEFVPQRRFQHDCVALDLDMPKNIADGYISIENQEGLIAVELELYTKTKSRIIEDMEGHNGASFVSDVWYYCNEPRIFSLLESAARDFECVKAFMLPEDAQDLSLYAKLFK